MSNATAPGVLKCMMLLALTDASLRLLGLGRTLKLARWLAGSGARHGSSDLVGITLNGIVRATAFYPGRSQCLEQSLAAFVLLRRRGIDAQLKLGVQPYPFFAHAWIEIDGVAVTESPDLIAGLSPLPELAL